MDLSVIYPIHITHASLYILNRIVRCLENTTQGLPEAEHIIALSGQNRFTKKAKKIIADNFKQIQIIDYTTPTQPFSPGIARNYAVKHASKNHLLFWDIDLLGSPDLFNAIPEHLESIQENPNSFEMYPCLYLCKPYTKQFTGHFEQAWQDATSLKVNSIEHFALATSTILCSKQHFMELGAFDEDFVGHMGEDLELLSRLALAYGRYPIESDYLVNTPSRNPSELRGFRKHFSLYGIPHLNDKIFTVHLYHSTRLGSKYKYLNVENMRLLKQKMAQHILSVKFSQEVVREKIYPFHLRQKPVIQRDTLDIFLRKTRKLIRQPKRFLTDFLGKYRR